MQVPSPADADDHLAAIAERAGSDGIRIAVAESVTAGRLAAALASGSGASEWLCGGVVAYRNTVKHDLLGVPEGPVITADCARDMARAACRLMGADVGVGITGVGGPDPVEDEPAGTVFIGVARGGEAEAYLHRLEGPPDEVIEAAVRHALTHLDAALSD